MAKKKGKRKSKAVVEIRQTSGGLTAGHIVAFGMGVAAPFIGLRLLPGSHEQSLLNLLFRKKYFLDNNPDPDEIAVIPKAGDLTLHDGRLWHRVALSKIQGEASRRRVIYVPIINGKYEPKNENSPTLFYQRFAGLVK